MVGVRRDGCGETVAEPARSGLTTLLSASVESGGHDIDEAPVAAPEADPQESFYRRLIVMVTVVGGLWRVGYLIATKWHQRLRLNDSFYYSSQAWQNAHGHWFRDFLGTHPAAEHAPLTSILLMPSSLLAHHEFWQRATNTIVGIAVIPLIAMVARRVGGRRVGVIAAAIAAVYANLWMNDSLIMSETISTLLAVLALWFAFKHRDRFDIRSALVCGAIVGLAALARSELVLLAALFALIGVRSHPVRVWAARSGVLLLTSMLVLVPWIAYNVPRFHHVVLISTNEGGALGGANCDDAYSGAALGGWSLLCVVDNVDRPEEDASDRSIRLRHDALSYARDHASRIPVVVAARIARSADLYGLGDLVRFDVGEERARWASWLGIVSWWALAPLAALGWWRQRRVNGWVLAAPAIAVLFTTVVFYGAHRLRSPMEPVTVICAAVALASWSPVASCLDTFIERRRR